MGMGKWEAIWGTEWAYVRRIGHSIIDPEEKRQFWENIKRMKEENPAFSIYTIFPLSTDSIAKGTQIKDFLNTPSGKISQEILAQLRGIK